MERQDASQETPLIPSEHVDELCRLVKESTATSLHSLKIAGDRIPSLTSTKLIKCINTHYSGCNIFSPVRTTIHGIVNLLLSRVGVLHQTYTLHRNSAFLTISKAENGQTDD